MFQAKIKKLFVSLTLTRLVQFLYHIELTLSLTIYIGLPLFNGLLLENSDCIHFLLNNRT